AAPNGDRDRGRGRAGRHGAAAGGDGQHVGTGRRVAAVPEVAEARQHVAIVAEALHHVRPRVAVAGIADLLTAGRAQPDLDGIWRDARARGARGIDGPAANLDLAAYLTPPGRLLDDEPRPRCLSGRRRWPERDEGERQAQRQRDGDQTARAPDTVNEHVGLLRRTCVLSGVYIISPL